MGAYQNLTAAGGDTPTLGSANAKGSYVAVTNAPAHDICGIDIVVIGQAAGNSIAFDLAIGTDIILPDFYHRGDTKGGSITAIPGLFIPGGANLQVRAQGGSGATATPIYIRGHKANAANKPLYARADNLVFDSANTRPNSATTAMDSSYTQITASTAKDYKAFMLQIGVGTVATNQNCYVELAVGGAGSEVIFGGSFPLKTVNSSPTITNVCGPLIEHFVPAGSRLAVRATATTTTDTLRIGLLAFY